MQVYFSLMLLYLMRGLACAGWYSCWQRRWGEEADSSLLISPSLAVPSMCTHSFCILPLLRIVLVNERVSYIFYKHDVQIRVGLF